MSLYFYEPDEYFDFGIAGELPVRFTARIEPAEYGMLENVYIFRVIATRPDGSEWDITADINRFAGRRERYADEIRADYLKKRDKDWEDIA